MAVKTSWSAGDVLTAADLTDTFAAKAPLASPTFTGTAALPAGSTVGGTAISTFVSPTWTSFTPSWTNLTVGNGTNYGFYCQIGKTVRGFIVFGLGSTSSIGSSPRFAAPLTISGNMGSITPVGQCYLQDTGVTVYVGQLNIASGGFVLNSQNVSASDSNLDPVTSANPFTWTSGDWLNASFQFMID